MTKHSLNNDHKQLKKIWQQVPADYYQQGIKNNLFQYLWHTRKLQIFKKLTKGRKYRKILDVGCASGLMTNKVAKQFPGSQIFGVDVYQKAIKYAKLKYPHINFIVADAHILPFQSSTIDLLICYETVEHVLDPVQALKEIRRVIKKGGYALVAMDSGSLLFRIVWWFWEKTKGSVWQNAHLHPFHNHDLEHLIKKAGFKILKKQFSHLGMEVSFLLKK